MIPASPVTRLTRAHVEMQNQVVTFEVPLLGTPLALHYRSDQVPGRIGRSPLRIPIGPKNPSRRLKAVLLEIDAPGQSVRKTFAPAVRLYRHEFDPVPSSSSSKAARVRIGYVYRASFPRPELTEWRDYQFPTVPWDARKAGLGGWTLNIHHRYEPLEKVIHFGDGRRQKVLVRDLGGTDRELEVRTGDGERIVVFNARGDHLRTIDALTRAIQWEFTLDSSGRPVAFCDLNGMETRVSREADQILLLSGQSGAAVKLRVDKNGFLAAITTPGGQVFAFVHSATGLLESAVAPGKRTHAFQYDEKGRVIRREEPGLGSFQIIARSDGSHQTVAQIDPAGRELISDRDLEESGQIVRRSRCCGGAEITSVTRGDGSEEISYPDGRRDVIETSAAGRTMKRTFPASRKVSEWKSSVNAESPQVRREVLEVNGRRYETVIDAAARAMTSITPEGRKTIVEVDDGGRVARVSAWNAPAVEHRHDARGNVVEIARKSGREERAWKLAYDAAGRPAEVRDPLGRVTRLTFDADDRLVKQAGPEGEVAYLYSEQGLLQALDAAGKRLPVERRSVPADPAVSRFTFAPGSGLVTSMQSADGIGIDVTRDGPLIVGMTYSGAVAGTIKREFDPDMRLIADEAGGTPRIDYGYDRDGLVVRAGKLSIERDAATGRIMRKRIAGLEVSYAYSDFGELREMHCLLQGKEIFALSQRHDALGRVVQKSERLNREAIGREYTYDAAGRLAAVSSEGKPLARFTYDANGNRLTAGDQRAQYDAADRILEFGSWQFEHDAAGNRTAARSDGVLIRSEYDAAGLLHKVVLPDGGSVSYLHDAVGRPCQRMVNGEAAETFLYDDQHRVLAVVDGRRVATRFVYATRLTLPEYFERENRTYFLVADGLGNPRLVVDVGSGTIVHRMDFDESGNITAESGERMHPFGFAGGVYDPQTRLTRFGVRYLDPVTARWTQPDPLGVLAGTNLYEYVGGDPINRVDPFGLQVTAGTGTSGGIVITITAPRPQWIPKEAGTTPVDHLNDPAPGFNFNDWIRNPKTPDPLDRFGPYKNPAPTQYDFLHWPVRCFFTAPHGGAYRTDDTGGLPRDTNTGGGYHGSEPQTTNTTVDVGVRF